jgi:hypothetical protein
MTHNLMTGFYVVEPEKHFVVAGPFSGRKAALECDPLSTPTCILEVIAPVVPWGVTEDSTPDIWVHNDSQGEEFAHTISADCECEPVKLTDDPEPDHDQGG